MNRKIETEDRIAFALAEAGVIKEDEQVRNVQKLVIPDKFRESLMDEFGYTLKSLQKSGEVSSVEAIKFLGTVNDYRGKAGLKPMRTTELLYFF